MTSRRRTAPDPGARLQVRMLGVLLVLALLLTLLIGRLGQLQLTDHPGAPAIAQPGTKTVAVPALRGRILDRDGVPLADHEVRTDVTVERRVLADASDGGEGLLRSVAEVVGRPLADLQARTTLCGAPGAATPPRCWPGSPYSPVPVAEGVDPQAALALVETPERYPGVEVVTQPVRSYPQVAGGGSAVQTVGYLGRPADPGEAEQPATDLVGIAGLEQQYDEVLRGRPGRRVVDVDGRGVPVAELESTPATPGADLVTTLDVDVQRASESALATGLERARAAGSPATAGGAVVLDLRDGGIVASASLPTYDPGVWARGVSQEEYGRLTAAGTSPLTDQVSTVARPPASTFKAVTLPGAVAAGTDLGAPVPCTSSYEIAGRRFANFESRAYGRISWHKAMVVSCDTVFYRVAERVWRAQGGLAATDDDQDPLITTARGFGLGAPTGVDLPGESAGRIPGRAWKQEHWEETRERSCDLAEAGYPEISDAKRRRYFTTVAREFCQSGGQFQPGDEANLSIGQGDVSTTLLQMARVYAAVALDGRDPQPHLGAALIRPDGAREELPVPPARTVDLPGDSGTMLRDALREVVTKGTARGAFAGADLPGWPVSGKTGTAEVYGEEDTSWFVSWAPSETPRYVVAVAVDEGGTGGTTAAGVARDIHEHLAAEAG